MLKAQGRFDAGAEKPQTTTVSPDGVVSCTGNRGSSMVIDLSHRPFIPPTAITCVLADGTRVECFGKFERNYVRIDAVDQENHSALWIGIAMA